MQSLLFGLERVLPRHKYQPLIDDTVQHQEKKLMPVAPLPISVKRQEQPVRNFTPVNFFTSLNNLSSITANARLARGFIKRVAIKDKREHVTPKALSEEEAGFLEMTNAAATR